MGSLSAEEVAHIARLARLELTPEQVQRYRGELATILAHIDRVRSLPTEGVEPMSHPLPMANRLAEDAPGPCLTTEQVLANAPAREGPFIAVPKVLDEGSA